MVTLVDKCRESRVPRGRIVHVHTTETLVTPSPTDSTYEMNRLINGSRRAKLSRRTMPPPSWPRITGKIPYWRDGEMRPTGSSRVGARGAYLGVLATASVLIGMANTCRAREMTYRHARRMLTGVEDADADLVRARGRDLDFLDLERLAGTPADGGLASNRLSSSVGHGSRRGSGGRGWTGNGGGCARGTFVIAA